MSDNIHPTALIDPAAQIGANVRIGPYSIIGAKVAIGDNVHIHSHVVIDGNTSIGAGCEIFPFAALGCAPQHTRYAGEDSTLEIGDNNIIREHVTMHPGTAIDAMKTIVGNNGIFMAATHVAHDCVVGDNVIFANNATLGGHAKIGSNVMMGGFASVQQFCRVGDHSMIGSQTAVDKDVIPFAIAVGNRASLTGINVIGLGRRGFAQSDIDDIRSAYRMLFKGGGLFADRLKAAKAAYGDHQQIAKIFDFIENASRNGICHAGKP